MKALIVGNSSSPPEARLSEMLSHRESENLITLAADGGAAYFLKLGVIPDLVIGDLDSLSVESLEDLQKRSLIYRYPRDKNELDLELAIREAIRSGASEIEIFSWADERTDYNLSALRAVSRTPLHGILLFSSNSVTSVVGPHRRSFGSKDLSNSNLPQFKNLSVHPLHSPVEIQSTGLRWELNWKASDSVQESQSNEIIGDFEIQIRQGTAFIQCY